MNNILVVNVNWLGDVVFSTPIFRALKKTFPQARISCLAVPRVKEILESCPFIDEMIVYDEKGRDQGILAKWRLVQQLRRRKFDIAFLLHRSWTRALLIYLAGIPTRVGHDTKGRGIFLTHKIAMPPRDIHRSDYYGSVIEGYGIEIKDRSCELVPAAQAKAEADELLLKEGIATDQRFVILNTGANWSLKEWPKKYFRELLVLLVEKGHKVVLVGATKDADRVKEIMAGYEGRAVGLAARTTLKQLIAIMARAAVVVTADSGPMHIASSVGTPVVGIFGPTKTEITGPRGRGRAVILRQDVKCNQEPCYRLDCPDNICMKAVTVDAVLKAIENVLSPAVPA